MAIPTVDASLLSCWEEKVDQGVGCSLILKHSHGKVTTILRCSAMVVKNPEARKSRPLSSSPTLPHAGEKKKRNKGGRGEKFEAMLTYKKKGVCHQADFMLELAALVQSPPPAQLLRPSSSVTNVISSHLQHVA